MKISVAHQGFAGKSWEFGKSLKIGLGCMVLEEACDAKSLSGQYYKVHIRLFCFSCALLLSFYMSKSLPAYNIILRYLYISYSIKDIPVPQVISLGEECTWIM